jgi:Mrp family chromosome partitioning ATPase
MENIKQALERARAVNSGGIGHAQTILPQAQIDPNLGIEDPLKGNERIDEVALNLRHLESNRIIAHDDTDFRSKPFDMLRTQVLQAMDHKNWKILGITSPTPGCGKTVTAINLAFSIARQPDRSALLVDLDLRKPHVAKSLGVNGQSGLCGVLENRVSLSKAIVRARLGGCDILVLPTETSTSDSSSWLTSRAMSATLQEIKRDYHFGTVILDLPPMLSSDDVIAILPQVDCLLLVVAVGKSTIAEIEECNRHLYPTEVVRLVLNKVPQLNAKYYPHYASGSTRLDKAR